MSYSIYLALGYLDPERSMNSLKAKVKNNRIIQDTGTGGSWPVSSDRIVWATAAWEIFKITGDKEWLQYSFNVIKNTLIVDAFVVYIKQKWFMYGVLCYLVLRDLCYLNWLLPIDIYESMTFGT